MGGSSVKDGFPHLVCAQGQFELCKGSASPLSSLRSPGQRGNPAHSLVKVMKNNALKHEFPLPGKKRDPPMWHQGFTQRTLKKSLWQITQWPQIPPISAYGPLCHSSHQEVYFPLLNLGLALWLALTSELANMIQVEVWKVHLGRKCTRHVREAQMKSTEEPPI